jgi:hypothetical protein
MLEGLSYGGAAHLENPQILTTDHETNLPAFYFRISLNSLISWGPISGYTIRGPKLNCSKDFSPSKNHREHIFNVMSIESLILVS